MFPNLALFMVTSIHSIWKSTKNDNFESDMESNRKFKAETDQKTEKWSW